MAVLVNAETKVLVQGITGSHGSFHTRLMLDYGTKIVAGVTPGKGGQEEHGVPVFDTVEEAVGATGAEASVIFVPPAFAADAVMEAAAAGIKLIVVITEGIPTLDMMRAKRFASQKGATIIGPNTPGIIVPGETKLGILPADAFTRGPLGVLSRSGTLTYEATSQCSSKGIGQSTAIGLGGDPIVGLSFIDGLKLFRDDAETEAVLLIGEIGGTAEQDAANFIIKEKYPKPVFAFIAGRTAPPGKRMGHAGAIIAGSGGTAEEKIEALRKAGVFVAESPAEIGDLVAAKI
ncbi:MAG: succinate--CoA ligase subunit alpha [Planctomycetota bacterium]|nr:MAG: succinate--CoA ligase subunit alpha [Planctomycetota bacterium]